MRIPRRFGFALALLLALASTAPGEDWLQFKYDCRHSGDVPERTIATPLGLVGAVPLSDAIFTSPVVAGGRVYAVDGSGVAWCIDAATLRVVWRTETRGGPANCSNVSSPALAGGFLHFGTTAGRYYVLDAASGRVIKEIACGEPIFSTPVVASGRVYFATLGSRVYALRPDGDICWTWDFVREVLKFPGDRWSGADWVRFKKGSRVTWRDQFCCSIDIAVHGKTIVLPAGGQTAFLEDTGDKPQVRAVGLVPNYAGDEYTAAFGQTIGADGAIYRQWHRRDNSGRVEVFRLRDGKVETDFFPSTQTAIELPGLMSFCSVSVRGQDVYRCRPEAGFGLCRHTLGKKEPEKLGGYPSIAPPILLKDSAVYGGLDGNVYVVPITPAVVARSPDRATGPTEGLPVPSKAGPSQSGMTGRPAVADAAGSGDPRRTEDGRAWSFKTAFGKAISAPVAVCDGRVCFGCEDGYLYVLGPGGNAPLPTRDLQLSKIRSPLSGKLAGPEHDWCTNYSNLGNTNSNDQGLRPPLRIKWIRRYEGTFKHLPVCGGGRMYTHTAEGQIFAVEQETGRLLWRRYFPDVYLSFTSPIYHNERLLVPQAGMKQSRLRCFDAATGRLLWEAAFSGSPSWSRQGPPAIWKNLAIYSFGSGKYAARGSAKPFIFSGSPQPSPDGAEVMSWIYTHDNPYYPKNNKPLVRAWDIDTGRVAWSLDFSEYGSGGNDSGVCLLGDTLYYSTFFGYAPRRDGKPGPNGLTAAIDPATGKVLWKTTEHSVTAGCTISGRDGRLYLGGYNQPNGKTKERYVRCLDARDGSLVWQSDPVRTAVNVVSVGRQHLFANASGGDGYVFDRATGKIVSRFNFGYACTRFALSEPCVLGCNMDAIDLSGGNKLVASGPAVDNRECVGAIVSNGRLFYTSQASGLQLSQVYGEEAKAMKDPWGQE